MVSSVDIANHELTYLTDLKDSLTTDIMLPNEVKMSDYVRSRTEYLNDNEGTISYGGGQVKEYEWRSQLSHSPGPGSLCAVDVYGDGVTVSSTLDNWSIEKWRQYIFNQNTNVWALCSSWTTIKETFSDVTAQTIEEAGVNDKYTVNDLTLANTDWITCMEWIHANPIDDSAGAYYGTAKAYGINFQIDAQTETIANIGVSQSFYKKVTDMGSRN